MASDLRAGFSNNINIVTLRESGTTVKKYTDRAIDVTGDGNVEVVTVTTDDNSKGGNKVVHTVTEPAGSPRTIVDAPTETDRGVNTTGSEFTESLD
jgi:hypothetical protein